MKIREFEIREYGPLGDTGKITLGNFNLFFGNNENGKTLTIDALIKLLLGKSTKDFKEVDRVTDDLRGSMTLDFDDNKPYILPDDGSINNILKSMPISLSSTDFRNIFIIRNSDLSIKNEADFYTGITEKLVGLRTTDIIRIKKSLREIGYLTENLDFQNNEKTTRLKDRLNKAEVCLNKIKKLKLDFIQKGFDKLELNFLKKRDELKYINSNIDKYEDARNREKHEKCSALLSELEERISKLKELDSYTDDELMFWENSIREISRCREEIIDLKSKEELLLKEISKIKIDYTSLSDKAIETGRIREKLYNDKARIESIKEGFINAGSSKSFKILCKRAAFLSLVVFIMLLLSFIFMKPSIYLFIPAMITLLIAISLGVFEFKLELQERKTIFNFEDLKLSLKELGIKADSIEDMMLEIQKINLEHEKIERLIAENKTVLNTKERHLNEVRDSIIKFKGIIESEEKKISLIQIQKKIRSKDEYRELLDDKSKNERECDAIYSKLDSYLGKVENNPQEIINNWKKEIMKLDIFKDRGLGITYDESKYYVLKDKKKELESQLHNLKERIDTLNADMIGVERDTNEILFEKDERLYCKTVADLDIIEKELEDFYKGNIIQRSYIQEAIGILDEIAGEEKSKVLELFSKDSPISVSKTFSNITTGLYKEVLYNRDNEKVMVRQSDGELIDAYKLSGGAYDQLYLSIRLALGEKLLQKEKGFFILDDPFIKSDIERIEKQMETLRKIAEDGWQILYFSAKKEIMDMLSDDINNNKIKLTSIHWTRF